MDRDQSHIFSTFHELARVCKCQSKWCSGDGRSSFLSTQVISLSEESTLKHMGPEKRAPELRPPQPPAHAPLHRLVTQDPDCNKRSRASLAIFHNDSAINHRTSFVKMGSILPFLPTILYMEDTVEIKRRTWWERSRFVTHHHTVIKWMYRPRWNRWKMLKRSGGRGWTTLFTYHSHLINYYYKKYWCVRL